MEPDYQRDAWYDQTPVSTSRTAPPPPPPVLRPKKQGRGLQIVLFSLLGVLVIAGSLLALNQIRRHMVFRVESRTVPALPSQRPEEFGDDFRAFFEAYYQPETKVYSGSQMKRVRGDMSAALEIVSSEGRGVLTLQELHRRTAESIVGIRSYAPGALSYSWGSGIVMSADGYIVTNEHIIDGAERAVVLLSDGREKEARLVGEDTMTDLAVLKIDAADLTPAEFGDSAALSVGDAVAAIGNPLGDNLSGTLTDGIISAIDRDIQVNGRRMTLLQTNAAINEGNSGGALLNMYGQVVGITNMKMVNHYSDVIFEGIGFAIPSATVKAVTDQLISRGEVSGRPGLGITVGSIPEGAAERYGLPEGLYISAVSEHSDAKAKGVRVGDVLTHINGKPARVSSDVLAERDKCAVGDTMTLTLWRDGESFDLEVELVELGNLY
ncbi:MAG: trypsin-like peptidase domain-containing protein [Oscillospiraceae bacterium]|nr:trypsin-like peptidase domain-containing protein [Oscillospiraceae bacterium]